MGAKTILLADDDRELVQLIGMRLEHEGFNVLAAHEGIQVLEMAEKFPIDLIVLDLNLPLGSGRTVLQALRTKPKGKNIPVIILTAYGSRDVQERVESEGVKEFLRKPCDLQALVEKIRTQLASS